MFFFPFSPSWRTFSFLVSPSIADSHSFVNLCLHLFIICPSWSVLFHHFHIFSYTWYAGWDSPTFTESKSISSCISFIRFSFLSVLVGVFSGQLFNTMHSLRVVYEYRFWFCFGMCNHNHIYLLLWRVIYWNVTNCDDIKRLCKDLECHPLLEAVYLWSCLSCYLSSDINIYRNDEFCEHGQLYFLSFCLLVFLAFLFD